jgi:Fungal Zn(2)-Cys(6) binuclear cluster domain
MTSLPPAASRALQANRRDKHACSLCARRKVKCDKGDPCSNCLKAKVQCLYDEAPATPRPRKRAADENLLVRLAQYEDLMRKHSIDFTHCANTWLPSGLEVKLKESESQSPVSVTSATRRPRPYPSESITANLER